LVPEGVEGRVAYRGSLPSVLYQLIGGLRAAWVLRRSHDEQLRTEARFIQVTPASVRESHPHDISIVEESPNYSAEHSPMESH